MAYGIIRVAGIKKTGVAGIKIHDMRDKGVSHTNEDIDFERSHLNYDLHNQSPPNFTDKINERIAELNLKRAVRKDANIMAQLFVSATPDWLHSKTAEQQRQYFQDAYDWACNRYGKENVISAIVHMDEATPHMHINLVPVADGRVSYEALFNERKRGDLTKLQDDFYSHNQSRGYGLERGEIQTDEGKTKHKKTLDFKIEQRNKELEYHGDILTDIQGGVLEMRLEHDELERKLPSLRENVIEATQSVSKMQGEVNNLETQKNALQGKIDPLQDELAMMEYRKKRLTDEITALEVKGSSGLMGENRQLRDELTNYKTMMDKITGFLETKAPTVYNALIAYLERIMQPKQKEFDGKADMMSAVDAERQRRTQQVTTQQPTRQRNRNTGHDDRQ